MVFLPHILKAASALTGTLASKQAQGQDSSKQQGKFADMLQSAMNVGSANATSSPYTQSTVKPDDIKSSANAVLDAIKKKIPTPGAHTMTPGIVNLPQSGHIHNAAADTKKFDSAVKTLNSAVASTPLKPLIEANQQTAQINLFNDNKSLVVSSAPSSQNASAGGWDRNRMDAFVQNKKLGSVMVGLKLPVG